MLSIKNLEGKRLGDDLKLPYSVSHLVSYTLFLAGLALIGAAWLKSYPVLIPQVEKHVFDNICYLFWPGLSFVFIGLYLISETSTNKRVSFLCAMLLTFSLYAHYMLFPMLPGSDSHYFRGLTKLFSRVGIDPTQQGYFQWPSFFILNNVLAMILGLSINEISKLVFLVIGFLISSNLFLLFLQEYEKLGFLGVALYFMSLFWFINYQFAPQSLALGLLLILVKLTLKKGLGFKIISFFVFLNLVFTHSFIPILFLIFYFFLTLHGQGSPRELLLYIIVYVTFIIYFTTLYFHTLFQTLSNIFFAFSEYGEYARIMQRTLIGPVSTLDAIAQIFSRGITLSLWIIISIGFLFSIIKKKVSFHGLALLLTGFMHFLAGMFFNILGGRAFQILFIPLTSGVKPFLEKYKKGITACLLLIFALFPFVIMHAVYDLRLVQTTSGERASDILMKNLKAHVNILSTPTDGFYVYGSLPIGILNIVTPRLVELGQLLVSKYDYIIYNPLLEKEILYEYGLDCGQIYRLRSYFLASYNRVWDDGYSQLLFTE